MESFPSLYPVLAFLLSKVTLLAIKYKDLHLAVQPDIGVSSLVVSPLKIETCSWVNLYSFTLLSLFNKAIFCGKFQRILIKSVLRFRHKSVHTLISPPGFMLQIFF